MEFLKDWQVVGFKEEPPKKIMESFKQITEIYRSYAQSGINLLKENEKYTILLKELLNQEDLRDFIKEINTNNHNDIYKIKAVMEIKADLQGNDLNDIIAIIIEPTERKIVSFFVKQFKNSLTNLKECVEFVNEHVDKLSDEQYNQLQETLKKLNTFNVSKKKNK